MSGVKHLQDSFAFSFCFWSPRMISIPQRSLYFGFFSFWLLIYLQSSVTVIWILVHFCQIPVETVMHVRLSIYVLQQFLIVLRFFLNSAWGLHLKAYHIIYTQNDNETMSRSCNPFISVLKWMAYVEAAVYRAVQFLLSKAFKGAYTYINYNLYIL